YFCTHTYILSRKLLNSRFFQNKGIIMLYKGVLMRELIIQSHWELFILMEIIASVSLILFLLVRYVFRRQSLSMSFLILFLVLMAFEAGLGYMVYRQTGELNTFQMIIGLFLLYACTFG